MYVCIDLSCRSKLAVLNEKLTTLERKIDYLEACVSIFNGKYYVYSYKMGKY